MATDTSYRDDIRIEPDSLDIEWVRHAQKYMKWAEKYARAEDKVRLCKEALEVIDAKIDKEIRTTSQEKITENMVKNNIALDDRHKTALQEYNDALYESHLYSVAVKAMEHRKSALENLVKLWAGSYFSGPKEGRDINRGAEKAKDNANVKARDEAREKSSKKVM